jgi:sarcosine oxidase gamma subunit
MSALDLQVREIALERCFELVAFSDAGVAQLEQEWPGAPGIVRPAPSGQQALPLHFAPGRWLLPDPPAELIRMLEAHPAATLVDVEGKYRQVLISGNGAGSVLGASIPLASVLAARESAAVTLFDCPAILARSGAGFEVWVHASYFESFTVALDAARRRIQSRPG